MSTIQEALEFDTSGYKRVMPDPHTSLKLITEDLQPSYNPLQRTPLPSTYSNPDSQRSFYQNGKIPQFRLARPSPFGGKTTINQTVNVAASSSSSSVSSGVQDHTVGYVTAALDVGAQEQGQVVMSKTVTLKRVTVSQPARVRLYSTAAAQSLDVARGDDATALNGTQHGVIIDVWLDDDLSWICSPSPVGSNCDDPDTSVLYLTVDNIGSATNPITVSLNFVGEEV